MNRGFICLFFATLFFSSMEASLKLIANDFHPMQINFTRFFTGGLLLLPFAIRALRRKQIRITLADWKEFALLGFIGLFASMMLYQTSILFIPASAVSVLFSCNPVLVLFFAWLILRSDIRAEHIIALALEITGAVIIINPWKTELDMAGVSLVLLSAALFALYAVLGRKDCDAYSGLAVTCFSCLAASAEMAAFMALSHVPAAASLLRQAGLGMFACVPFAGGYTVGNIAIAAYVCIGVTAGGYAAFFLGMESTSPMLASLVFFFKPILAPLFAMAVLDENIPWNMWAGIGIILAGSVISLLPALRSMPAARNVLALARKNGIRIESTAKRRP